MIILKTEKEIHFKASNTDDILIIDIEFEYIAMNYKWSIGRNKYGNITSISSRDRYGNKIHLPRAILRCNFSNKNFDVDHKDRNRLNNKKENLQLISHQDNCRKAIRPLGTSKYRGVYWRKDKNIWAARIRQEGFKVHLGYFKIEEDAARMYDKYAERFHGEFAILNFPRL